LLKKARSVEVEVRRERTFGEITVRNTLDIKFQRPNRFALRTEGAGLALTVVSDGKTVSTSVPQLQRYTEAEAPASLAGLTAAPLVKATLIKATLIGSLFPELLADDPYEQLMTGVKTSKYAGIETLNGSKAHLLKFTQDELDWEVWVAADGDPLIRRVRMDLTKSIMNRPGAEELKGQKLLLLQDFKEWRIDRKPDESAFAFTPPKGSSKVDDLFGGLGGAEPRSPLLGKPAPDLSLNRLEGEPFRLKDHRDTSLVVLDFWATWCGPCVQELPILAEVAKEYQGKGVVFCAVNQREKAEKVRKFLKENTLQIDVALDAEGEAGASYHAEAIPMLVLIDKKGTVRAVHVGFEPGIKATLKKELDALLAGKELDKGSASDEKTTSSKDEGLGKAWALDGPYSCVAGDAKGRAVYAVRIQGGCDLIDAEGKTTRTFDLSKGTYTNARGTRRKGGRAGLLTFRSWGESVLASGDDGTKLWEEASGQGVDDVWAADLDGDGVDEVIVGYNGATGLHAFSSGGERLWKRTDLGNVWHVTAGDMDGDGGVDVVTTSAQGKVHITSAADGKPLRTLDPGLYANMVRTAPGRSVPGLKGDVVLVVGTAPSGLAMVALGGDGKTLWTTPLPADTQSCDALSVSPDGRWAAAGLRGGRVCVVELVGGRIVAQVSGQGLTPSTGWLSRADAASPLLVVATGRGLNAFRVEPVAAPGEKRDR